MGYVNGEVKSCSLCGFCNVSVSVYAVVVYLVIQIDVSNFMKFTASKTQVAPP